jgi:hypothetical protein
MIREGMRLEKPSQGVVMAIPFPTHLSLLEQRLIVAELNACRLKRIL